LENPSTSNGHLYVRKVAVGNGWASMNGLEWSPSVKETYSTKYPRNAQGGPYALDPNMIEYGIGGRVSCPNNGSYTLTPDPTTRKVLPHLLKFTKLIHANITKQEVTNDDQTAVDLIPDEPDDARESEDRED